MTITPTTEEHEAEVEALARAFCDLENARQGRPAMASDVWADYWTGRTWEGTRPWHQAEQAGVALSVMAALGYEKVCR